MDCQNVQAAIDAVTDTGNYTGIRREEVNGTIGAHVRHCHDCRRYSDETAVLLTLLGAQPRIDAPADFDFKLRARLARADETAVLLTLLGAQPRIEAPADFDFKLRARLARAKSEPAAGRGLFEKLHAMSYRFSWGGFSWGQAAAATATLAVITTVTALNFSTGDRAVESKTYQINSPAVEKVAASVQPPVAKEPAATVKRAVSVKSGHRTLVVDPIPAAVRTVNLNLTAGSEAETEGKDYIWRGYDPETGQFVTTKNRDLIGAENSASTIPKTPSFVPSI
jgi:hypothetical protein